MKIKKIIITGFLHLFWTLMALALIMGAMYLVVFFIVKLGVLLK